MFLKLVVLAAYLNLAFVDGRWKCGTSRPNPMEKTSKETTATPPLPHAAMMTCKQFITAYDAGRILFPTNYKCGVQLIPVARHYIDQKQTMLMLHEAGGVVTEPQDIGLPVQIAVGGNQSAADYKKWEESSKGLPNLLQNKICRLASLKAFKVTRLELFTFDFKERVEKKQFEIGMKDRVFLQLVGSCQMEPCNGDGCDRIVVKTDVVVGMTVLEDLDGVGCAFTPQTLGSMEMISDCPKMYCKGMLKEELASAGCFCGIFVMI